MDPRLPESDGWEVRMTEAGERAMRGQSVALIHAWLTRHPKDALQNPSFFL